MTTAREKGEVTLRTRWLDSKGREWAIVEKLPFGRNVCTTTCRRFQMDWKTSEIKAARKAADADAPFCPGAAP